MIKLSSLVLGISVILAGCGVADSTQEVVGGLDPIEVNVNPDVSKQVFVLVTSEGSRFVKLEQVGVDLIYKFDDSIVLAPGWNTLTEAQAQSLSPDPTDTAIDTLIREGGAE